MTEYHFIGVDVSKDKFDASILVSSGNYLKKVFQNTTEGIKSFIRWIEKQTSQPWVCMEATGFYGYALADALSERQVAVSVINPLKIKNYARALFSRNKNDSLDACLIAQFGQAMRPYLYTPKTPEQKQLNDRVKLLNMLKGQLVQLSNQKASLQDASTVATAEKIILATQENIATLEKELAELVKQNKEFKHQLELLTSISGIGNLTAYRVLASVQDINQFETAKQFAAFIGVSPRQNQSGKFQGKTRMSCLGNANLRKALYMAAVVAKRRNKALQPFVKRLTEAGKAPKAIVGAVMAKLARWIFALLKHNKPFDVKVHQLELPQPE